MPTSPTARLIPRLRQAVLASESNGLSDGRLLGEFIRTGDPDAFAVLVRRHGPMVLGVCRRVVGDPHLAEDAFQATFLVLARKAASVRGREQVGNWLYGVAYRSATKARAARSRRRARETQVDIMPQPPVPPADLWDDLQPVLDAELARLPDRYRLPVVLCDLEGRPQREVARRLGLPPATLANRLATARRTLAKRLTERGIALSGGVVAAVVSANAAGAAVPAHLADDAVRYAGAIAAGGSAVGMVPAPIVQLSDGVIHMMVFSKLKATATALAVFVVLLGGAGLSAPPGVLADDTPAAKETVAPGKPAAGLSDPTFLDRICRALRGSPPTGVETAYFVADADPAKRSKVVLWLVEEEQQARKREESADLTRLALLALGETQTAPDSSSVNEAFRLEVARLLVAQNAENDPPPAATTPPPAATWLGLARQMRAQKEAAEDPAIQLGLKFLGIQQGQAAVQPPASDESFLQSALKAAHDREPTRLEREYFLADKDPKKREKLLDTLLADPVVLKKLGTEWKKVMLVEAQRAVLYHRARSKELKALNLARQQRLVEKVEKVYLNAATANRFEQLLTQLLDGKRSDDQVLDALTAALLGRLATESERKLILTGIARQSDRMAAWKDVVTTLADTDEAKQRK